MAFVMKESAAANVGVEVEEEVFLSVPSPTMFLTIELKIGATSLSTLGWTFVK